MEDVPGLIAALDGISNGGMSSDEAYKLAVDQAREAYQSEIRRFWRENPDAETVPDALKDTNGWIKDYIKAEMRQYYEAERQRVKKILDREYPGLQETLTDDKYAFSDFVEGEGSYADMPIQERLDVLRMIFPDKGYYISEMTKGERGVTRGRIVTEKKGLTKDSEFARLANTTASPYGTGWENFFGEDGVLAEENGARTARKYSPRTDEPPAKGFYNSQKNDIISAEQKRAREEQSGKKYPIPAPRAENAEGGKGNDRGALAGDPEERTVGDSRQTHSGRAGVDRRKRGKIASAHGGTIDVDSRGGVRSFIISGEERDIGEWRRGVDISGKKISGFKFGDNTYEVKLPTAFDAAMVKWLKRMGVKGVTLISGDMRTANGDVCNGFFISDENHIVLNISDKVFVDTAIHELSH